MGSTCRSWLSLADDRATLPKRGAMRGWHIAGFVIDSKTF